MPERVITLQGDNLVDSLHISIFVLFTPIIIIIIIYFILFNIVPHPVSNCSWRFTYIKMLKYKYTPEEKHINILVTYKQLKIAI